MGKYPGFYTTQDVSRCECREASALLRRCGVPRKVRQEIISMIKEAWFQFSESNRFWNDYTEYMKEIWDIDINEPKYMKGYFRWEAVYYSTVSPPILLLNKSPFMRMIGQSIYGVDKNTDLRKAIRGK